MHRGQGTTCLYDRHVLSLLYEAERTRRAFVLLTALETKEEMT